VGALTADRARRPWKNRSSGPFLGYKSHMFKRTTFIISLAALTFAPTAVLVAKEKGTAGKDNGWELLFDGKDMSKWRGYKKPDLTGLRWKVEKGCLTLPPSDGSDTLGARDIVSVKQYGDFELVWQWSIEKGGNSGVKYFVTEDRDAAIGHEYQEIDDAGHADAQMVKRKTASFYDVLAAPKAKPKAPGQVNNSRILVKGNKVEHWLNGAKVLAYDLDTDELRKAIAESKFKGMEGFDKHKQGHLLLQDHGHGICYKQIKVRELK
jgi:hypothetical protein